MERILLVKSKGVGEILMLGLEVKKLGVIEMDILFGLDGCG